MKSAQAYSKNLSELISSIRTSLNKAELPFILGRINPPFLKYSHFEIVRKAQVGCPLPATYWVNCDDLTKKADNLHYDAKGQIELGRRLALEALKALNTLKTLKTKGGK